MDLLTLVLVCSSFRGCKFHWCRFYKTFWILGCLVVSTSALPSGKFTSNLFSSLMFITFCIHTKLQHLASSNNLIKQQPRNYTDICLSQFESYTTVICRCIQHTLFYSLNDMISVPVISSSKLPIDAFQESSFLCRLKSEWPLSRKPCF